jgi:hypothetical protein
MQERAIEEESMIEPKKLTENSAGGTYGMMGLRISLGF